MILHKFSQSPFGNYQIEQKLSFIASGDAMLFTQDSVYVLQHQSLLEIIKQSAIKAFILTDDIQARGLNNNSLFTAIDYAQMVDLTLEYQQILSW